MKVSSYSHFIVRFPSYFHISRIRSDTLPGVPEDGDTVCIVGVCDEVYYNKKNNRKNHCKIFFQFVEYPKECTSWSHGGCNCVDLETGRGFDLEVGQWWGAGFVS